MAQLMCRVVGYERSYVSPRGLVNQKRIYKFAHCLEDSYMPITYIDIMSLNDLLRPPQPYYSLATPTTVNFSSYHPQSLSPDVETSPGPPLSQSPTVTSVAAKRAIPFKYLLVLISIEITGVVASL